MDSFIGWIGGKRLLRKHICNCFPDNVSKYIEVFGGAAWVLFYKKHAEFEVYNDINSELVNLFKCVKYHPEAIIKEFEYILNSREIFKYFKNQNIESLTEIQRATRYLYIVKASYGSNIRTYNLRPRKINNLDSLKDIQKRLEKVVIENKTFDNLIKTYDSKDTLFYCDPPYFKSEKLYDTGDFIFDVNQHMILKDILSNIKGKFILSYNNCDFIKNLYKDYKINEISRDNNLSLRYNKDKIYNELIIKNF